MITPFIRIRGIPTIIVWLKQFSFILLCSTNVAERDYIFYFSMSRANKRETAKCVGWVEINANFWNISSSKWRIQNFNKTKSSLKDRRVMRVPGRLTFCIRKYFLCTENSFQRHIWSIFMQILDPEFAIQMTNCECVSKFQLKSFSSLETLASTVLNFSFAIFNCFQHNTFLKQQNFVNKPAKSLPLPPTYDAAWFKTKYLSCVPVLWTIRFLNVFHVV